MARFMTGKAPWDPVTTKNAEYQMIYDTRSNHLSGGWVSKKKNSAWKQNPSTKMHEYIEENGQHYKVPEADYEAFVKTSAFGTYVGMLDNNDTQQAAMLQYIKDAEASAVTIDGTGHILKLSYSEKAQTLIVTFNNEKHGSDTVAYFRVPVQVWSELQVLAENKDAMRQDDNGEYRHLLGIRFWDLIRQRKTIHGSKFAFTYTSAKETSRESYDKAIADAKKSGFTDASKLDNIAGATQEEKMYNYLYTEEGHANNLKSMRDAIKDKHDLDLFDMAANIGAVKKMFKLAAKYNKYYDPDIFFAEEEDTDILENGTSENAARAMAHASKRKMRETAEEQKQLRDGIQSAGGGSQVKVWSESAEDSTYGGFNKSDIEGSKAAKIEDERRRREEQKYFNKVVRHNTHADKKTLQLNEKYRNEVPTRVESASRDIEQLIVQADSFSKVPAPVKRIHARGNRTGMSRGGGRPRASAVQQPSTQGKATHRRNYREMYMESIAGNWEKWHEWENMSDKEHIETVRKWRESLKNK